MHDAMYVDGSDASTGRSSSCFHVGAMDFSRGHVAAVKVDGLANFNDSTVHSASVGVPQRVLMGHDA
eukprot:2514715-Karenia_brevis.AAC.1